MELRTDDLLFVVLGIVPGAVIGGRLGYVLLHPAFFAARPAAILDPGVGSLELGLAVVGGALTGGIVAALLDGTVGRWFHIAALPVLVVIGVGKLATVLGGRGQGVPSDAAWATAYLGPGPWGSLAPEVPSCPPRRSRASRHSCVLVIVMGVLAVPGLRRPDGRAFLEAVGLWALDPGDRRLDMARPGRGGAAPNGAAHRSRRFWSAASSGSSCSCSGNARRRRTRQRGNLSVLPRRRAVRTCSEQDERRGQR